tara:strand:- start:4378 stop:4545 length:168 start_codon:yes stop_codon:yes gene_type:complete
MSKYKWVVTTKGGAHFLQNKPREVRGGFMDEFGKRIVGTGVELHTIYGFRNYRNY